jgi:hypothetical protein
VGAVRMRHGHAIECDYNDIGRRRSDAREF